MSRSISIVFIPGDLKGLGEFTRDGKYVDGHGERLRPDPGLGLLEIIY